MIDIRESQELMEKLIELRDIYQKTNKLEDQKAFREHEYLCINKFSYLVTMRTNRYRNFENFLDLQQDGYLSLISAMKTYNPKKGNFFFWAHKYISIKISRSANSHSVIRFPMKFTKEFTPHKEGVLPIQVETKRCPDQELEKAEIDNVIQDAMNDLTKNQRKVINLYCGFDIDKPQSINKICKEMKISRTRCLKILNSALTKLENRIKL